MDVDKINEPLPRLWLCFGTQGLRMWKREGFEGATEYVRADLGSREAAIRRAEAITLHRCAFELRQTAEHHSRMMREYGPVAGGIVRDPVPVSLRRMASYFDEKAARIEHGLT